MHLCATLPPPLVLMSTHDMKKKAFYLLVCGKFQAFEDWVLHPAKFFLHGPAVRHNARDRSQTGNLDDL